MLNAFCRVAPSVRFRDWRFFSLVFSFWRVSLAHGPVRMSRRVSLIHFSCKSPCKSAGACSWKCFKRKALHVASRSLQRSRQSFEVQFVLIAGPRIGQRCDPHALCGAIRCRLYFWQMTSNARRRHTWVQASIRNGAGPACEDPAGRCRIGLKPPRIAICQICQTRLYKIG